MRPALVAALALLPLRAAAELPALMLPVEPACISSPFGAREGAGPRASRQHGGVDLPAPAGAWVRAAAAGQVVAIRRRGAAGLEIDLRHPGGWVTRYAHLGAVVPALATGKRVVAQGERLGRVGRSGITYGTHLHFELLAEGVRQDPAPHLPVGACVARQAHSRGGMVAGE
ncbi:M23 family metallopeptidase [Belnapia rosea]|uniref:Peptidase family M23 n=1 Tax=Belnapia rosea TaxID=938405 RepID=A0A1G6RRE2_9PROT|nr:M23 family metallopeptidase [Belnapia rosea]SDB74213.1 Peptidase family M23 [Belnapia rosea]SDD07270.1 Peptidase family M23 [Belnapia rosea]